MRRGAEAVVGFVSGVLSTNALPHLATAAAGKRMLTPLGGAESSAGTNLLWGGMNLAAGMLLSRLPGTGEKEWSARSAGFCAGCIVFAAWAAIYETVSRRRVRQ